MLLSLEEMIAFVLTWFRRQVWGLIKAAWWWRFRSTPRMRLYVAQVMFAAALQGLKLFLDAGLFRSGQVPKLILRVVDRTGGYLDDWKARAMSQPLGNPSGRVSAG